MYINMACPSMNGHYACTSVRPCAPLWPARRGALGGALCVRSLDRSILNAPVKFMWAPHAFDGPADMLAGEASQVPVEVVVIFLVHILVVVVIAEYRPKSVPSRPHVGRQWKHARLEFT